MYIYNHKNIIINKNLYKIKFIFYFEKMEKIDQEIESRRKENKETYSNLGKTTFLLFLICLIILRIIHIDEIKSAESCDSVWEQYKRTCIISKVASKQYEIDSELFINIPMNYITIFKLKDTNDIWEPISVQSSRINEENQEFKDLKVGEQRNVICYRIKNDEERQRILFKTECAPKSPQSDIQIFAFLGAIFTGVITLVSILSYFEISCG